MKNILDTAVNLYLLRSGLPYVPQPRFPTNADIEAAISSASYFPGLILASRALILDAVGWAYRTARGRRAVLGPWDYGSFDDPVMGADTLLLTETLENLPTLKGGAIVIDLANNTHIPALRYK